MSTLRVQTSSKNSLAERNSTCAVMLGQMLHCGILKSVKVHDSQIDEVLGLQESRSVLGAFEGVGLFTLELKVEGKAWYADALLRRFKIV
jgi:hypothetical protein